MMLLRNLKKCDGSCPCIFSRISCHKLIDLRVYYSDDEGQFKPTKKGVSLSVGLYTEFKKAIHSLEKTLLDLNLITAEELADAELVEMDGE